MAPGGRNSLPAQNREMEISPGKRSSMGEKRGRKGKTSVFNTKGKRGKVENHFLDIRRFFWATEERG